jgi:hypothetical protein
MDAMGKGPEASRPQLRVARHRANRSVGSQLPQNPVNGTLLRRVYIFQVPGSGTVTHDAWLGTSGRTLRVPVTEVKSPMLRKPEIFNPASAFPLSETPRLGAGQVHHIVVPMGIM